MEIVLNKHCDRYFYFKYLYDPPSLLILNCLFNQILNISLERAGGEISLII